MESPSSALSARKRTFEFEDGRNLCKCGDLEVLWTSWTQENHGRRFYGCRNYSPAKERYRKKGCNHFSWYNCEMCERAKEVINGIKAENRILLKEKRELMKKSELLYRSDIST
ncbi:hypothetical protein C2S52_023481 [Perilla frutescens var. hirtella]|nr:hypothetical protein C2S52_023481 [Perilla frutescens var. hirtella]